MGSIKRSAGSEYGIREVSVTWAWQHTRQAFTFRDANQLTACISDATGAGALQMSRLVGISTPGSSGEVKQVQMTLLVKWLIDKIEMGDSNKLHYIIK